MMNDITDKEYVMIRDYIKEKFGISLGNEKKSLVYSRLRTVVAELGMSDFTEYFNYMKSDRTGEAGTRFIDKITTNHTFFMREADHFNYFRDTVLPYIHQKYASQKDLRLWCAACSSGEEAYTLQMIVQDFFADKPGWNTEILATDISTQVLDKAIKGIYTNESLSTLSDAWRKKYLKPLDADYSVMNDDLKKKITFRKFNLMEENLKFKKPFQVIFCRNVMIYFDNKTRDDLVARFYNVCDDGAYLFIGHSESLNQTKTKFKYLMPALYRK